MQAGLMAVAALALARATGAASSPTFCERMATQLDMTPVERGGQGRTTGEWRVSTFTTMQRLLTGGSSMISFAMRPVGENATVADYQRIQRVCAQSGKEILCRVEEPMILAVSAGKGKAEIESRPGERAEVGTKGSRLFCRDPRAMKAG